MSAYHVALLVMEEIDLYSLAFREVMQDLGPDQVLQ
jgi:hypothetical protein